MPSENELELINKYTRRNLTQDEVYIFSVVLCDNDIDRDNESFSTNAIYEMKNMFIGKTGIYDHNPKAENQTARIFDCQVEKVSGRKTVYGSDYYRLVAKAYIPKSEATKDFILAIDSGINKEVSVGCAVSYSYCSICGVSSQEGCSHKVGKKYGESICHRVLDSISDVYEWSFVAVPSQREAGVIKSYNRYKGGKRMEDIFELIKKGKCITLTEDDCKSINNKIKELEIMANEGKSYKDELQKSVMRLYSLAQPNIPVSVINGLVEKMDITELKAFKKAYENTAPNTQTFYKGQCSGTNKNIDFNI